jgi:DNA-binding NtrC family response regulator
MNGPEMVETVLHRRPDMAVLFTTAYPANAVVHGALLDRRFKVINKPFVLGDLARAVREVLDRTVAKAVP